MSRSLWGGALGLVLAAVAHALPCLDVPTSHTDQRELDALRAAVETSCGCEAAASRRAYRRCARQALVTRLDAGDVRAECRRDAKRLVFRVTCGTARSTCGLVRANTLEQRGCALRPASRCRTRRKVLATTCEATHCADVEQWTAGTCLDPRASGPFAPGGRRIAFVKDSVADPGTPRVLETVVWYPSPIGAGPIDGATGAVLDAPLDPTGGPYPLVLFSHGSCGFPTQSNFLNAHLATHGFIVAAPPHPGNTFSEFPACGTPQAQAASLLERPNDVIHVLDELLAAAADAESPFFGLVDSARVGMMGHSFGGLTTYLVADREPRIRAAAPLAPFAVGAPPLPVPSLTMIGAIDSVVPNAQTRLRYEESAAPKQWVSIAHAGHYAFSVLCFPSPDCQPPTTLTQAEAHRTVRRWVLPFLQVHVAGDEMWRPLLAPPTPPGVAVESVG